MLQNNSGYCAGSNRNLIWTRKSRHSSPAARETSCNTACEGSYAVMHFVCACNPSSYLSETLIYRNISKKAGVLGQEDSKALLGLHVFTGCDSVSAFPGIGKAAARKNSKSCFKILGNSGLLPKNCASSLSRFCVQCTG